MEIFTLENSALRLEVSSQGGTIEGLWWKRGAERVALLRPGKKNGVAVAASCFPLVPFANRVSGNRFTFAGREYQLAANTDWDSHYLHGDGWLAAWRCVAHDDRQLTLTSCQRSGVYHYDAVQRFRLGDDALEVTLEVTNRGAETLPFGLGWHPYFPLTPQTLLQAPANGYWLEREQWLAGDFQPQLPTGLDFNQPAGLPRRWVNNGIAGWDGAARIIWPEARCALQVRTEPPAPYYFIFVSDPQFDPGYAFDFFCIEPMSHAPDDHHRPGAGRLIPLAPGEETRLTMRLQAQAYG
ncbi:aldose 1-epimerase [Entomohabitans teleogrylli]|uniref:aldose 1-epimerase n=1 Tax=Entomohabitans teleogrylli TaxID=1384589 RepID=UPI00073D6C91|nr:aldose 1-epimerase [Entomohabitans teleogrylli]